MKTFFLALVCIGIVYFAHEQYEVERFRELLHRWGQEQRLVSQLMKL